MNQQLKKLLQAAYEAPVPEHRQEFLERIGHFGANSPKINGFRFLLTQVSYISKKAWLVSFAVFFAALGYAALSDKDVIWMFSAVIPFLAVTFVTESVRSEAYGMAELEMASRFSLKSLLLARMEILGLTHLLVLCLIALMGCVSSGITLLRTGVYLLVPYLLTDAAGLWIVRKIRGREGLYGSLAAAALVALLPTLLQIIQSPVYAEEQFVWWLVAIVVLGGVFLQELEKRMRKAF